MKNIVKLFGVIALVAVIGFSMAACGGGSGGGGVSQPSEPTSAKFKSADTTGNTYVLEITKAGSRAAYQPQSGDNYTLTITNVLTGINQVNKGTVTVAGNELTLSGGTSLTVTISNQQMTKMTGTITLTDGTSLPAPTTLTSIQTGRTFSLYLITWGDDNNGTYGEEWMGGLHLSDFTPLRPKKGDVFTFKTSGTTDKPLKDFQLRFESNDGDKEIWQTIGRPVDDKKYNISGTFDLTFDVILNDDPLAYVEKIQFRLASNKSNIKTGLPKNTILATISNFDVTLVKVVRAP